jgi:hypothetical protein
VKIRISKCRRCGGKVYQAALGWTRARLDAERTKIQLLDYGNFPRDEGVHLSSLYTATLAPILGFCSTSCMEGERAYGPREELDKGRERVRARDNEHWALLLAGVDP